ncbi:hypothetical protein GT352_38050 [Streptomyces sp. SID1046]|uniref:hypothetical protein n=1 Tax=Streptomyces sp. SID1046 TaxID=2690249 RepID=UPI00136C22CD|nr:hypothetical protein [Streptomyces sp. SID1046]MYV79668.1 hypothetical protein [Streptomyces sp. SID1046]
MSRRPGRCHRRRPVRSRGPGRDQQVVGGGDAVGGLVTGGGRVADASSDSDSDSSFRNLGNESRPFGT